MSGRPRRRWLAALRTAGRGIGYALALTGYIQGYVPWQWMPGVQLPDPSHPPQPPQPARDGDAVRLTAREQAAWRELRGSLMGPVAAERELPPRA